MSQPESDDAMKARRGRNIALALGLVLFVILVFFVTMARMHANSLAGAAP